LSHSPRFCGTDLKPGSTKSNSKFLDRLSLPSCIQSKATDFWRKSVKLIRTLSQIFTALCFLFRQRLLSDTKLIVGCPMISSAANMKFWLYLCQASNLPEATAAMKPFSDAAAKGKQSLAVCCQEYNANLMQQVSTVCGKDFMPAMVKHLCI